MKHYLIGILVGSVAGFFVGRAESHTAPPVERTVALRCQHGEFSVERADGGATIYYTDSDGRATKVAGCYK